MNVRPTQPARGVSTRLLLLLVVMALLLPLPGAPVSAATKEIKVRDNAFEPAKLSASVGDTVTWKSASASRTAHNVRQDRKIFYSGEATGGELTYSRRFSAGTFPYYCEIHGYAGSGMTGTIKVPVRVSRTSATSLKIVWATGNTNTGTRFDVQFKVGGGAWKSWKQSVTAVSSAFGQGKPVDLKSGVRYSFRARSIHKSKASKWSPVKSFTP